MDYVPIVITQENLVSAVRANIQMAYAALATKIRVSRAMPMPPINANGNSVRLAGLTTTLYSAVTLGDMNEMLAGTYVIPPNNNAAGNDYGPGIYPSKPQGDPLSPLSTEQYGGRILGDTAGDGN
jgi:hypothetical protein